MMIENNYNITNSHTIYILFHVCIYHTNKNYVYVDNVKLHLVLYYIYT